MQRSWEPVQAFEKYICGVDFYSGEIKEQVVVHHYCQSLTEIGGGMCQCLLFDGNHRGARMIGIEYIITAEMFEKLPKEEKIFWHSNVYEVKSGLLVCPGISHEEEEQLMKKLIGTYGKTIHTWKVDQNKDLPLGLPQLMMFPTKDSQVDEKLLKREEKETGISIDECRKRRETLHSPPVKEGADSWMKGHAYQFCVKEVGKNE